MKHTIFLLTLLIPMVLLAQDTTKQESIFHISGFVEAYYSYDFNNPSGGQRPSFIYSHNRHNEFTANLAYLKGHYSSEKIRANLALATGTYMQANYAAEPDLMNSLYEANVGIKISRYHNLWLDIGVLPSHIGFESAYSPDCATLTRSIIAENSPYYEAGAKLTYISNNEKWLVAALALNGWQRIQRVEGNSLMSWGTQVQYRPNENLTLNYSNFIGTDKTDSARQLRFFHNLYGLYKLNDKVDIILGFDAGQEQEEKGSDEYNTWYGAACIVRVRPADKWLVGLRGEYYSDPRGVIIFTGTADGNKIWGVSVNADRQISKNCVWRTELRHLKSDDAIFLKGDNGSTQNNTAIITSVAITF